MPESLDSWRSVAQTVLDVLELLVLKTPNQVDDRVVALLTALVDNDEVWQRFVALVEEVLGDEKPGV